MDGRPVLLICFVIIHTKCEQLFDPYIASNSDDGRAVTVPVFTSQLGQPIQMNRHIAYKIPDYNDCDNFDFLINITTGQREVEVKVYNNFSGKGSPKCTVTWSDSSTSQEEPLDKSVTTFKKVYSKFGIYPIHVECYKHELWERCPPSNAECLQTADVLDDMYKSIDTPLVFFFHKPIMIKSYMQITNSTCGFPDIIWNVTRLQNGNLTDVINITQPGKSVLYLVAGTIEPGDYIVDISIAFPAVSQYHISDEFIIIQIVHPELVTYINGGEELYIPHDQQIYHVNASESYDPAELFSTEELHVEWYLVYYDTTAMSVITYTPVMYKLLVNYPDAPLPGGGVTRSIQKGTDYVLQINSTSFPVSSTVIVMFAMSRGTRVSSAMQVLRIYSSAIPISLLCVHNCHIGRERMFYHDKIEADVALPKGTSTTGLQYSWQVSVWNVSTLTFTSPPIDQPVVYQTLLDSPSIGITSPPEQGVTYRIIVTVYTPDRRYGYASYIRTGNTLPYRGSCDIDSLQITSARDWVTLSCLSWYGNDDRRTVSTASDNNPILTYTVLQQTDGAALYEEPILQTRSRRSHVIVKVGDPAADYNTTLRVRVTDMFDDYTEVVINATALPAFSVTDVSPTQRGADIIKHFNTTDYVEDEKQLRDMGKDDMIITFVTAVCSNMHLVELPVRKPKVPRVLNTDGSVIDLNADGNTDVGTINEALTSLANSSMDPATEAVQDVIRMMAEVIEDVVADQILGETESNKMLSSLTLNACTNLVYKEQFMNTEAKLSMMSVSRVVGLDALNENSSTNQAAQIEITSGEIYRNFQASVNAIIPDTVTKIRPVEDLINGFNQIDDMLTVLNNNVSLYDTKMSPMERAYLYMKMQQQSRFDNDGYKNGAKTAANVSVELAREVQSKLKLCSECNNRESKTTQQLVHKNTGVNVNRDVIPTKSMLSQFRIDGLKKALNKSNINEAGTVGVSAFEFDENVYMYDDDGTSAYVTSKVLRVDVKAADEQIFPDEMTFDQFVQTPAATRVTPDVSEDDASEFMYHTFIYQKSTDHVCLIVQPVIGQVNETNTTTPSGGDNITYYEVYFRFEMAPSTLDYDFMMTVYEDDDWMECLSPRLMKGHTGITYIGISMEGRKKLIDYNLTIVTVGCLTWDEIQRKWHTDKCELDWIPDRNKISCTCYDVTDMVFANSFFVAPNSIDFNSVFLKFSPLSQAAVIGVLAAIFVFYIIGVLILKPFDNRDRLKWGMTPLCDNIVSDNQFYIIKIFTGMRRGAGTSSSIAFNLRGTHGETGPRSLSDGIRPGFSRGSCITFFMATHRWLGPLEYLSIWHDTNSEDNFSSWYLNQIVIVDVSKQQSYTFVAEQWLSVQTNVFMNIRSHTKTEPISFEARFFYQTRDRLSESHMWASIFYRPQTSVFTRVQRLSCAVVYILLNMIANAMYFNPEPDYVTPPLLEVGPFRFTGQQIYISLISALITTPPIMILVYIFKHIQPSTESPHGNSCGCCCCCQRPNRRGGGTDRVTAGNINGITYEKLRANMLTSSSPDSFGKTYVPHRMIYLAWVIVLSGIVVPSFFILLYSMEWGKQKSEEWLTCFTMSLFESATLVDPVMIVCVALVLACITRVHIESTNDDIVDIMRKYRKLVAGKIDREKIVSPPLEDDPLENVQREKKHITDMTSSFRDIVMAAAFAMLVFSIAFVNRDDRSYQIRHDIVNTIVTPWKMPQFSLITTPGDVYTWMNVSVIPNLFPETYYNGEVLHWTQRESMHGQYNLRLGPPRLRQLRSTKSTCTIPYIGNMKCNHKYSIISEDERSFCIGWKNKPCSVKDTIFSDSVDAWLYTSALDIWGLPLAGHHTTYGGGGYIATFAVGRSNTVSILNELFNNTWINRQTRAVLFEFTLYNPGINMFIYNEFLVEFPETGGALTSFAIYPMRLYSHHGGLGTFTIICELMFLVCLFVFFGKFCIRFYQQGRQYFKHFWQVYELVLVSCGVTAVVVFFIRITLTGITITKFQDDKRRFVNFAHIVLWDQIYVTLLGVLSFMSTIRLLQTFSASNRIKAIVVVFDNCGKDLFWFGTTFTYILIGFCMFGLFLFGAHLSSYMSIYRSMTTLCLAMIGKSKFAEIDETQPVLAKIFFLFYILTVVFYTLTIFMSILGASIDTVVHDNRAEQVKDLLDYMGDSLKRLLKKPREKIGRREKPLVSFTRIEKIHIRCDSAFSRSITPTPRRDSIYSNDNETAITSLPPHAFSRFKTTRLQKKISDGHSVFVGE